MENHQSTSKTENHILVITNKKEGKFLRKKTENFGFQNHSRTEIKNLIDKMKEVMNQAKGIGLSANQVGLNIKVFIAQIYDTDKYGKSQNSSKKFYAIFNPEIIKLSKEKTFMEEGCLSIPGIYGDVERPEKVILSGFDKNGRKIKIKAWGLLARIFQHEIDHLDGKLFIDRSKKLYKLSDESIKNNH